MPIVFMDGWEIGFATSLWDASNVPVGALSSSIARSGRFSLLMNSSGRYVRKNLNLGSEFCVQFAIYYSSTFNTGIHLRWRSGGSVLGTLNITSERKIALYTGDGATLRATGNTILNSGWWYVIEVYVKISDTEGMLKARLNGVDECVWGPNVDTKPGTETNVDAIEIYAPAANTFYVDDVVISTGDTFPDGLRVVFLPVKASIRSDAQSCSFLPSECPVLRQQAFGGHYVNLACYLKNAGTTESLLVCNPPLDAATVAAIAPVGFFGASTARAGVTVKLFVGNASDLYYTTSKYVPPTPRLTDGHLPVGPAFYEVWETLGGSPITPSLISGVSVGVEVINA